MTKLGKTLFRHWPWALTIAFFCFGFLLIAQYQTNITLGGELTKESESNLAMILIDTTNNKDSLEVELAGLRNELADLENIVESGASISETVENRIESLACTIGDQEVSGQGITIIMSSNSNMLYYDLIDIVNELYLTGAEAIAINNIRINSRTTISERYDRKDNYNITVNGEMLSYPIVIKAIGDSESLETGMTYPGGIISNLNTIYKIYPTITKAEHLTIPASNIVPYQYASPVTE